MSSGDQEEQRNRLIRSMFVNLQPLNSPQRETAEEVYSNAPPTPELTIEYVRLRNDDDELTDPERLENYIKTLRAESEAKKKQRRVDDDISTDELEENDATDPANRTTDNFSSTTRPATRSTNHSSTATRAAITVKPARDNGSTTYSVNVEQQSRQCNHACTQSK
ncbi:uncharacterized protein LOC125051147 isoform X2 [Pieris napi]|uniref:uncharacterized protein LOC125051147 isoform X2 n=1 Tax=Pieris napi TaxID=78633 RepID=UPI001FBAF626|nr:uncharacterized protein LOC125051147 isoform X2 [Pieris napi]